MLVCQPDHDLAHAGIGQLPETTNVVSDRPGIENRRGASPVTATRPEPFDQFGHVTVVRADQYRRQVGQLDERRVASFSLAVARSTAPLRRTVLRSPMTFARSA